MKPEKQRLIACTMYPGNRKNTASEATVPRLRPLVLLVTVVFWIKMNMEPWRNDTDREKPAVSGEKLDPVTPCSPRISHQPDWNRTQVSTVTSPPHNTDITSAFEEKG